jgi:hypothetical protein
LLRPIDRLASDNDGQATGRRDAQSCHRFADDVLAQHRAEGSEAITTARVQRSTCTLELNIDKLAGGRSVLSQQDRPAIAEHRKATELVASVRLGDRIAAAGQNLPGKQGGCCR